MILKAAQIGDTVYVSPDDNIDTLDDKPNAMSMLDFIKNLLEDDTLLSEDVLEANAGLMYVAVKVLSYYPDVVGIAQYFDKPNIPNHAKYKALFYAIPKQRRFEKWPKKTIDDSELIAVANYYKVSHRVANMYMKLLTPDDIMTIVATQNPGGLVGKAKKLTAKEKKASEKEPVKQKVEPDKKQPAKKSTECPIANNMMVKFFK